MDFLKDMNHRMNLVEATDKELLSNMKSLNEDIASLNMKSNLELQDLKNECKLMAKECKALHKAVFKLGSCLRDKVSTARLDELKKSIEEWKVEDFATRKDLITSFEYYSR